MCNPDLRRDGRTSMDTIVENGSYRLRITLDVLHEFLIASDGVVDASPAIVSA